MQKPAAGYLHSHVSLQGLLEMSKKYPIIDIRGRGLMVALEFGEHRGVDGSYTAKAGCATAVMKAAQKRNMILLTAGELFIQHVQHLWPFSTETQHDLPHSRSAIRSTNERRSFCCILSLWYVH